MIILQLRQGNYDDIRIEEIWKSGGILLLVAMVILAILSALTALIITDKNNQKQDYNAKAEVYNALSLEERKILYEYSNDYEDADPETYYISYYDINPPKHTLRAMIIIGIPIMIIIASLAMAAEYSQQRRKEYSFADFPLRTPLEIATFCAMFAVAPFMLVSFLRMLPYKLHLINEEQREVERLAMIEARRNETWQEAPLKIARCTPSDAKRYCKVRTDKAAEFQRQALEQAQKGVDSLKERLCTLGQSVQNTQRQLNEAKAKLAGLQAVSGESISPEFALAELQAIREMRGVSRVVTPKVSIKNGAIVSFVVEVRVPYKQELYDFGDYEIAIYTNDFKCKHLRSGIKKNAASTRPSYATRDGFCFGERSSTIRDYICAGRIVEAATLIVDSLHSVNHPEVEREIPECFRKVKIVQKRAKQIRRWTQKVR